MLFSHLNKSVV